MSRRAISLSSWSSSMLALTLAALVAWPAALAAAAPVAKVTVEAGKFERKDTPLSVPLGDLKVPAAVRLVEVRNGLRVPVPAQVEGGGGDAAAAAAAPATLHFVLTGTTPAGATRTFELEPADAPARPALTVKEGAEGLDLLAGEARVLHYRTAALPPPAGKKPLFTKSAFVHPLLSPGGKVLTRIHAPDHIHHMGLWNAWTLTEFEGRKVDFWNIGDGKGTVRYARTAGKSAGPASAALRVVQEHVDLSAPGGEKVALLEDLEIRAWNPSGDAAGPFVVDWTSHQRCASASPLKLPKYRYGGLGFRGTGDWNTANSDYLTSEGRTRKNGHGTRARWCITQGQTSQGPAGVAFLSHPQNRSHPEPMRIWPGDNNGAIFFNFVPIQQEDWTLEPGNTYALRYRLVVFDGTMDKEAADRHWRDFGDPPTVKVEKM